MPATFFHRERVIRRTAVVLVWTFAVGIALATLAALAFGKSMPFWGARQSLPAETPFTDLEPGQFIWFGDAQRSGPLLMIVSIDDQRGYVYRNGVLTGVTTLSTGKKGHETPTGVFTILQKNKEHYSNLYNNAPMPYMQRLTWGGIALHAGGLPGYPASHGCIRLPSEFARLLFEVSSMGMTVVIASASGELHEVAHPGFLSPVDASGQPIRSMPLMPTESMRWQPELAPEGPLSAVVSRQSGRIVVYRAGVEIGRARAVFSGGEPIGTHVFTLVEGASKTPLRYTRDFDRVHWISVGVAGREDDRGVEPDATVGGRVELPEEFVARVNEVLTVGATLLLTDAPITAATSGAPIEVINADPPEEAAAAEPDVPAPLEAP